MSRDPILFRVDATPETGYEHLARCMTLAAALQRRRRPAFFLSRLEPGYLGMNLKRAGNEWVDAETLAGSHEDLTETIQEIRRIKPAGVVVDSSRVSEQYLEAIRETGVMLVNFDHLAHIRFPSNLLVNPMIGPDKEAYEFDYQTQILMGARYALVRSEVRRTRAGRSQEPALIHDSNAKSTGGQYRVMISLGEDDPHGQTIELAKLLLNAPRIGKVDAVVRSHHRHVAQMQEMAESMPERFSVAIEPSEVAARIVRSHFAITSGSGWSLELAAVGMPQLIVVQTETHWPNAQRLEEEGCATCLGWHENTSAQTIRTGVHNLITDPDERQSMSRCGRMLIDARGPDRLVTALEVMLHPTRLPAFRAAA